MSDFSISKHTDKNNPLFFINGNNYLCKVVNIIAPNIIKVVFKPHDTFIKVKLKINNITLQDNNDINNEALQYLYYLLTENEDYHNMIHFFNNNDVLLSMIVLYFDPGLGAMLVQALIAAAASVIVFSKNVKAKIQNFFSNKKGKKPHQDSININEDESKF